MKFVYVVDKEDKLKLELEEILKKEVKVKQILPSQFDDMLKNIPDILIMNENNIEGDILEYCKKVRNDDDNSITPIIVVSKNKEEKHIVDILKNEVEMYLPDSVNKEILYYSIKNIIRLLNSNRMVSPLTGLPGNIQIQAEMKKRLSNNKEFAMLYLDLDNFKAYNDTYGFSNGDEMIKFTAKVIQDNIFKSGNEKNFVGHIGGDDFIAIVEESDYEKIAQDIITDFDMGVQKYFNKEDIENGFIEVENRKGIMEQYPLTSISIGVVDVAKGRFKNTLEIGEAGAAVKHLAKTIYGSTYVIDRRKVREEKIEKHIK